MYFLCYAFIISYEVHRYLPWAAGVLMVSCPYNQKVVSPIRFPLSKQPSSPGTPHWWQPSAALYEWIKCREKKSTLYTLCCGVLTHYYKGLLCSGHCCISTQLSRLSVFWNVLTNPAKWACVKCFQIRLQLHILDMPGKKLQEIYLANYSETLINHILINPAF